MISLRLFERLPEHPIITVGRTVELLGCSRPAAAKASRALEAAGILQPLDGRKKNRALTFALCLGRLREGTEAPPNRWQALIRTYPPSVGDRVTQGVR